jgi:hypothetical protein
MLLACILSQFDVEDTRSRKNFKDSRNLSPMEVGAWLFQSRTLDLTLRQLDRDFRAMAMVS